MKSLEVKITTADDIEVTGTYIPGSLPIGVVLLHMMPAAKESYAKFAERLSEMGLHTLAIDLRGHGQSGGGNYQNFTNEQHQKSILDVKAAVDYLHKQNPGLRIGFVGASIGSSLAIQYAAANPVAFLVLLSAGLNYKGIETGRMVVVFPEDLPVCFVSALDDERVEGNAAQTETLYNAASTTNKTIQILREGGHGTEIIEYKPEFESLLSWIKEVCEI
ncbi:MAG: lysophospholipase [Candidatus Doudnabacteria bacterium]|nr:lysophospholipase [Candidatus Doudnabacteria bacterium]